MDMYPAHCRLHSCIGWLWEDSVARVERHVQVIATIIKAKFEPALAYATEGVALQAQLQEAVERAEPSDIVHQLKHVVWTKTLQRMHFLAKQYVAMSTACAYTRINTMFRGQNVSVTATLLVSTLFMHLIIILSGVVKARRVGFHSGHWSTRKRSCWLGRLVLERQHCARHWLLYADSSC